jgi:hypothetical protein
MSKGRETGQWDGTGIQDNELEQDNEW